MRCFYEVNLFRCDSKLCLTPYRVLCPYFFLPGRTFCSVLIQRSFTPFAFLRLPFSKDKLFLPFRRGLSDELCEDSNSAFAVFRRLLSRLSLRGSFFREVFFSPRRRKRKDEQRNQTPLLPLFSGLFDKRMSKNARSLILPPFFKGPSAF